MRRLLLLLIPPCSIVLTAAASPGTTGEADARFRLASVDPVVRSHTSSRLARASGDSFVLFGGPDSLEGKFEAADGAPDRQGWIGIDFSDEPPYWQRSTFNAENLGSHGAGNQAMWCGQTAEQQPTWVDAPGYGNNWFEVLMFESEPLADPSIAQTVELDFYFNHELEPGYDYFTVAYDSAGIWREVASVGATNKEIDDTFPAPGVGPQDHPAWRPIVYAGNDYGWNLAQPQIRLRLVVRTDGAFSDEEGLWPTTAGAVQVDDLRVRYDDGTGTVVDLLEDFEGPEPYLWSPLRSPFVGDFSKVFARFEDIDPCRGNTTPVMTFIDDGTPPANAPAPDGTQSTGGETSPTWSYGVPGGWVVNRSGGLSDGQARLDNQVWSPPIAWDLPGPEDDGIAVAGAELRFDVWAHLPLLNAIVYTWSLRSSTDEGLTWSEWLDDGFQYHQSTPAWLSRRFDVTDLLPENPTHVQIALGVTEIDIYYQDDDSTPSPVFDNVSFVKYELGGPILSTSEAYLAQSGFPPNGSIDTSSPSARDALDVPFDMARDLGSAATIVPGDSVVVDVVSRIRGAEVADVRMVWKLWKNPLFEDALRAIPNRAGLDENVDARVSGVWSGEVVARPSIPTDDSWNGERWFVDLPDVDLLYPGDVLHYYLQATDTGGRVCTFPADLTQFDLRGQFDPLFVIRGLPSISTADGAQPPLLWLNGQSHGPEAERMRRALSELGFVEGLHFDTYTPLAPRSLVASSGIGSAGAHGATAAQLAGYSTLLYDVGDRTTGILSNGSGFVGNDRSDDVGVLRAWHDLPGARNALYFGDSIASGPTADSAEGASYVREIMGIGAAVSDVSAAVGGSSVLVVRSASLAFQTDFAAYGGCPKIAAFDLLLPAAGATASHRYLDAGGLPIPELAAAVLHDRLVDGHRKVDLTFPFGNESVWQTRSKASGSLIVLTQLLRESLDYFGVPSHGGDVAVPVGARSLALGAAPNPFNPATVVTYAVPRSGRVRMTVYDLRGARVRTLLDETVEAGAHELQWDGRDDGGAGVASGVYVLEMRAEEETVTRKVAVLK